MLRQRIKNIAPGACLTPFPPQLRSNRQSRACLKVPTRQTYDRDCSRAIAHTVIVQTGRFQCSRALSIANLSIARARKLGAVTGTGTRCVSIPHYRPLRSRAPGASVVRLQLMSLRVFFEAPSIDQSILSPSDLTTGSQKMTASARTLRKLSASDSGVPSKPISVSICR